MPRKKLIVTPINDGYVEPVLKPEDYIFGAGQVDESIIEPSGNWDAYLPLQEIQVKNFETYGCTAFGASSQIEILEKKLFGGEPNYSDRALYTMSGIKPPGENPQVIYETVRKQGLLNETDHSWSDSLKTLNEYAIPLPQSLLDKALAWLNKYIFRHEWLPNAGGTSNISPNILKEALKRSPLAVAVYAWAFDGVKYVRNGQADTHWAIIYGTYDNGDWKCFDSYAPFLKRIDRNFGFRWAKRIWLGKNELSQAEISIFQSIIDTIKKWVAELTKKVNEVAPIAPIDETIPPPAPPKPKYLWGTPAEAKHSVRLICDEEGLKTFEKDLICAVIQCESGFKTEAKNRNADGTLDLGKILERKKLGIAQLNTYWYIDKMKLITREEAINNPEKSVRIMIKRYKQGFLKDWVCYKKGLYKQYLPKVGSRINKQK